MTAHVLVTGGAGYLGSVLRKHLLNARYMGEQVQIIYDLELDKDGSYSTAEKLFRTKIGWKPLLSVRAAKRRLRITEIPGDEPPRIGCRRKLQILR